MVEAAAATTRLGSGGSAPPLVSRPLNSGVLAGGSSYNGIGSVLGNIRNINTGPVLTSRSKMGVENIRSVISSSNAGTYNNSNAQNGYTNGTFPNGFSGTNGGSFTNGCSSNSINASGASHLANHGSVEPTDMTSGDPYRRAWNARNGNIPPAASSNTAVHFGVINNGSNSVNNISGSVRTMGNGVLTSRNDGYPRTTLISDTVTDRSALNNSHSFAGDLHSRQSKINCSINDKINDPLVVKCNNRSDLRKCNINNGVNSINLNHRLNPGVSHYEGNHLPFNSNQLRCTNDSEGDHNTINHAITRNSSNNSSTASSRNSHPSTSSNSITNRQPMTFNSSSNVQVVLNNSGHTIQGILRHPGSNSLNNTCHASSADVNHGGGSTNKVVRINPHGYPQLEGQSSGMTRQPSDRVPNNNEQHNSISQRLHHSPQRVGNLTTVGEVGNQGRKVPKYSGPSEEIVRADNQRVVDNPKTDQLLTPAEELRKAATVGDLGKIQTLLGKPPGNAAGAALVNQLDELGSSALLAGACEGRVGVLKLILRHGANVDHQDKQHGNTALHEAAWKGYSEACQTLVRARADLRLRNRGGFAPLHLACQNGHNQSCRVLLLSGADPDIKNNYGDTPLHTAARYGHAGVTRILLSARAEVQLTNKNGDGCLHIAAAMGRRKLTRILLEAGAVQTGKNKQNETPQNIARRKDFSQILEILLNPPPVVTPEEQLKREKERAAKEEGDNNEKSKSKKSSKDKGDKKRTNDSGTSSKDSSTRTKEKKKLKGDCKERRRDCKGGVHWSPYGCHNYTPLELPTPDTDAIPKDALKSGEQYFVDLAGNIKKGPVAVGTACYCAPLLRKVEHKMETDKVALMDHIDAHHEKLDKRIHSLERKTHTHINHLKETVQKKIIEGKQECLHRTGEKTLVRQQSLEAHGRHLQQWVEDRLAAHDPALPPTLKRTLSRGREKGTRDPVTGVFPLTRSRSEEAMTEVTVADIQEPSYKGLRVLDHPTSMYNLHQPQDDEIHEEDTQNSSVVQAQSQECLDEERQFSVNKNTVLYDSTSIPGQDNNHQGSLDLMQDSSDSEGEDEEHVTEDAEYVEENCGLQRGVGRLSLKHPYYANTGAIPKGSMSSLPENMTDKTNSKEEIIKAEIHAPSEPSIQRWTSYNKYDPRNNKHYLYDVQEVEPNYGVVAEGSNPDGRVRDSGCSEGSSRSDINDVAQFPISGETTTKNLNSNNEIRHQKYDSKPYLNSSQSGMTENPSLNTSRSQSYLQNAQLSRSNSRDLLEPRQQIQLQQQASYEKQQQNSSDAADHYYHTNTAPTNGSADINADDHQYGVAGCGKDGDTYLDMDRYRIQQAVRRLYDGYLHDPRLDPGSSGSGSSGGGSGSGGSSGCSVGGSSRSRTTLLESSLEHDPHNDSGYSTRMCTASQGPSPALSGASGAAMDGSGSDSRSGQSTSSPNTTVVAYPHIGSAGGGGGSNAAAISSRVALVDANYAVPRLGNNAYYATPTNTEVNTYAHGNAGSNGSASTELHSNLGISNEPPAPASQSNNYSTITASTADTNNYSKKNSGVSYTSNSQSSISQHTTNNYSQSNSDNNYLMQGNYNTNNSNSNYSPQYNNTSVYNGGHAAPPPPPPHHHQQQHGYSNSYYTTTTNGHYHQPAGPSVASYYNRTNNSNTSSITGAQYQQANKCQQYYAGGGQPNPPLPQGTRPTTYPSTDPSTYPSSRPPPVIDIITIGESSLV